MNGSEMQHGFDWSGQDLAGWYLSEKFDGCRAYWDGKRLWSRGGLSPEIPAEWAATLPDTPLDCELYDGIGGRSRCAGALRYGKFSPRMRLMVFDAPAAHGNHLARLRTAKIAVAGATCAAVATVTVCRNNNHALELLREIKSRDGEGLMARSPILRYVAGRTGELLKVK